MKITAAKRKISNPTKAGAAKQAREAAKARGIFPGAGNHLPFNALTPDGLRDLFGVSQRTVADWIKNRKIGFVKIGRSVRFTPDHIQDFIARHNVRPFGKHDYSPTPDKASSTPKVYLTVGTVTTQVNLDA